MNHSLTLLATAALALASGCTQPAAEIVLKGSEGGTRMSSGYSNSYVSSGSSSYIAPASQDTSSSAGVQSIGVTDLSAPAPAQTDTQKKTEKLSEAPAKRKVEPAKIASTEPEKPAAAKKTDSIAMAEPAAAPIPAIKAHGKSAFIQPVEGRIISHFGAKGPGIINDGINIAAEEGEPVVAAADGEVAYAGNKLKSYGNVVILRHAGSKTTTYAHLARMVVNKRQRVQQGDIIGYVGASGNVKEPQLHFALRKGKQPLDPETVLPSMHASMPMRGV